MTNILGGISDGVIDPWIEMLFKKILPPGLDILPDTDLHAPMINITPWNSEEIAEESAVRAQVVHGTLHTMNLTQNTRMTEPTWYQDVRHLVLRADEDIRYQPGDVAILHPENSPEDVETLLKRLGWEAEADKPIRITPSAGDRSLPLGYPGPNTPTTLRSLITKHADINSVPRKSFVELLAHFTKDQMETDKLHEFCTAEGLDDLFDYTTRVRRTILEVLLEFRSAVVPKDYVADLFPELRPRQFSIASSSSVHPREIHLCVAIVNYRTKLRVPRKGVCTSWLARLETGTVLNVGIKRGTMHLPRDDRKPIILVGPGTGVAPMRAMIEERVTRDATENTLYFGCRSATADHHFREEWEAYQKQSALTYRVAASRDQVPSLIVGSKTMQPPAEIPDSPPEVLPRYPEHTSRTQQLQEKIKEMEARIQAIEQRRGSLSPTTSSTRSISNPPDALSAVQQPLAYFDSPISNDSSDTHSTPPMPFISDSFASLPEADFTSYPNSGYPRIEVAIARRMAAEGINIHPELLRSMLAIFVHRRGLTGYKLHTGRVLYNLSASPQPVLALLYAILLAACHFTEDPELKSWESAILERTKSEIEANIARAHEYGGGEYNPLYHLQAMLILSQYYYFKSRMLEAHVNTNSTVQFAVAMGIHRLNSRSLDHYTTTVSPQSGLGRERWRPQDVIELGEAINLLWGCVARDLVGGLINGLPPSLSPEEITTVWPVSLSDFIKNSLPDDRHSVKELLSSDFSYVVADVSQDNAACLLIKALVLVYYAGKFDTERFSKPELTEEWWSRFRNCDRAIERISDTMPSYFSGRNPEEVSHLVLAHAAIDCATLQLHGALAEKELVRSAQGDLRHANTSAWI
ncbi:unnamed protein product [Rhizoctonia solani]|uniref:FAD-binding FR-type domain-containing protein n=1 Tax=Rhizoctonia solani TaxID=456999 RepID=A0A8H2WIP6_9AGAM|nr:unnamed protein product [Rhizoctonia solani]